MRYWGTAIRRRQGIRGVSRGTGGGFPGRRRDRDGVFRPVPQDIEGQGRPVSIAPPSPVPGSRAEAVGTAFEGKENKTMRNTIRSCLKNKYCTK